MRQPTPARHASIFHMSELRIVRGTAALPADIEDRFRVAFGREMNQQERKFFGIDGRSAKLVDAPERESLLSAA